MDAQQTAGRTTAETAGQAAEDTAGRTAGQAAGETGRRPAGETGRRPAGQTPGRATRETARRTAGDAAHRPRGRIARQTAPAGAATRRTAPAGAGESTAHPGGRSAARSERRSRPRQTAASGDPSDRAARKPRAPGARGALGRYGEELAARRLTEAGMTILARNWRAGRTGEIDIVARDADTLVICEVKTRRTGTFEHPMAAVTRTKAARLRGLAGRWLQEHGAAPPGGVRIDLVGIVLPDRGAPEVEHARGVA